MTRGAAVQGGSQPPATSVGTLAFFPAMAVVIALAVVMDSRVEQVAPMALGAVAAGIMLLWHRPSLRWSGIVAVMVLVILLVPIRREDPSSLPFALEPYRVLLTCLVAAWIAALLVDRRVTLRRSVLDGPLVLILAATTASVIVNAERSTELGVTSGVTKALVFLLGFLLFFWLMVSVLRRFSDVDLVVRALVIGAAFITIFSLIEARTGFSVFDQVVRLLPGSGRPASLDPSINLPIRGGRSRIFGSAQHPIELSAIMAMLVPLAFYLAHTTRRLRWGLALALLVIGTLATLSRTGLVMLVVVVVVFAWLKPRETLRLWPLVIPGVVVVHAAAPGAMRELLWAFFPAGGLFAEQTAAGSGRLESLGPALHEVALRPLLGGGYGSRIFSGPQANSFIVDDMWLALGMEVGIVGVAAWAWLFVRFIRRSSREARLDQSSRGWFFAAITASVSAFAVGMFLFDAFSFVQVTFLLFILLALAGSQLAGQSRAVVGPAPLEA